MREILFRAKRIDNEEWVEGYYIYHIKRTVCPIGDSLKPEDEQHVIMQDAFSDWNMPRDTVVFEIDPKTICQYTGLKDKNGSMIWENDIVRIGANTLVRWSEKYAGWCLIQRDWIHEHFFGEAVEAKDCEVVGNIFDNPELMEK